MPGSNPRALEKARTLSADGLIFDLEDAVAPEAKESARTIVAATLAGGGYGHRELVIRVNAIDTPWGHADLAAAAAMPIDAVLLPKIENPDRLALTVSLLDAFGASERLAVWCMLETHDRLPLITSLSLAILAARAHGLAVLDGVHLDLSDDEGFAAACRQGRELGFDGKTLIHPKQIGAANAAFAPTSEEVEWSRRIIAAHSEAAAAGKGVALVEGQLIENLHVENARRLLALADEIRQLSSEK
jgi:citrate lyase subunit beta/citryl-CoA lyase